ncbi:MAG: hypothetical protein ACRDUV_10905 [Pseudonocardiaceae bacterium]
MPELPQSASRTRLQWTGGPDPAGVEGAVAGIDPEPIREHYVVIGWRRYPAQAGARRGDGTRRGDFTTHQARWRFGSESRFVDSRG